MLTLVALSAFLSLYDAEFLFFAFKLRTVFEHDFLAHILLFAGLSVLATLGWGRGWAVAGALCLLAVALEAAQVFSPSRQATLSDLAGNLVGVLLGIALVHAARRLGRRLAGG